MLMNAEPKLRQISTMSSVSNMAASAGLANRMSPSTGMVRVQHMRATTLLVVPMSTWFSKRRSWAKANGPSEVASRTTKLGLFPTILVKSWLKSSAIGSQTIKVSTQSVSRTIVFASLLIPLPMASSVLPQAAALWEPNGLTMSTLSLWRSISSNTRAASRITPQEWFLSTSLMLPQLMLARLMQSKVIMTHSPCKTAANVSFQMRRNTA